MNYELGYTLRQIERIVSMTPPIGAVNLARPDAEAAAQGLRALITLADEAQILVNIIRANTRDGVCTLTRDMTMGTVRAINAARSLKSR